MKGCLTVILLILLIALVVNYPFFTIGIALAIWGIYEWKINKIWALNRKTGHHLEYRLDFGVRILRWKR